MVWLPPKPCATSSVAGTVLSGPRCVGEAGREQEGPGSGCRCPRQGNRRLGQGKKPLNQEKCSGVRGQDCSQLCPAKAPST